MAPPDLLGSGRTRGLSGDAQRVLPAQAGLGFFDQFLRRHHTVEDLVADCTPLWDGPGAAGQRCGLRRHLMEDPERIFGRLTDILIVVNRPDWRRALAREGDQWQLRVRQMLRERFRAWCLASDLQPPPGARPVDFRLVEDGTGPDADLGLRAGDFVSGCLPNGHLGAESTATPLVDVLAYVPGSKGWEPLATLYGDQLLLTLGNHWLDNGQHPALPAPALYQLRRGEDGELVHLVHPELRDRFSISTRTNRDGQPVLALSATGGPPFAFLALCPARRDRQREAPPLALLDEVTLQDTGFDRDLGERIRSRDEPVGALGATTSRDGLPDAAIAQTVEPTSVESRILSLRERGALLQKVHFGRFIEGYDVSVGADGSVGSRLEDPVAVLRVRGRSLSVHALAEGLKVDRQPLEIGQGLDLEGDHLLRLPHAVLELRDLRRVDAEGWPYLAELRRDGDAIHAVFGGRLRIGRSSRCRVRLPDDPFNENIVWRPEVGQGAEIRSRQGNLPRARFYIDAIMVAAEHAEVDLTREPLVHALSKGCYTYVRRGGDVIAIPPTSRTGEDQPPANLDLLPGDELLVGNCVFEVEYPPAAIPRAVRTLPPDIGPLRATDLAAAVSLDEGLWNDSPLPQRAHLPAPDDAPAAHGLGERGPAPPRFDPPASRSEDSLELNLGDLALGQAVARHLHAPPNPTGADGGVRVVEQEVLPVELGRPARLTLLGWQLDQGRRYIIGNHGGADLVVPELRCEASQRFRPQDYLRAELVGGRLSLLPLGGGACRLTLPMAGGGAPVIEIDRHDELGEPDFTVRIEVHLSADQAPQLRIDLSDRRCRGLFVTGLQAEQPRTVWLGHQPAFLRFDGEGIDLRWGQRRRVLGPEERVVVDGAVFAARIDG